MTPIAIAILSLSMSADAFAASIGQGAARRPTLGEAVRGGLVFGVVEAITPLLGWAAGLAAANVVSKVDHWIAFVILGGVGLRMIWVALTRRRQADDRAVVPARGALTLVAVAIGTSIDAAAVGVSLAFVGADIVVIAAAIGLATFVMTTIGMTIGRAVGRGLGSLVEVAGGVALIAIGTLILVEHLGLLD